jgi:hypothetical protein
MSTSGKIFTMVPLDIASSSKLRSISLSSIIKGSREVGEETEGKSLAT